MVWGDGVKNFFGMYGGISGVLGRFFTPFEKEGLYLWEFV